MDVKTITGARWYVEKEWLQPHPPNLLLSQLSLQVYYFLTISFTLNLTKGARCMTVIFN